MKSYLFYDVETSGLNPAFDQILTFACIRTDLSLNEIDRQTITVQLRKDIVPSPGAFLTHGLTKEELDAGISEYRAAVKIHKLVNTPGTISLGYNSLGFDDEFLRFLFYRNLLDPYSHQYSNGCSRMDVLPMTAVFRVFYPQVLEWPENEGKPSLKLDLIAQANNFQTSGRAHEAMNDVEALIALSRAFYLKQDIWTYCLDFFNKTRDTVRINSIEKDFEIQGKQFTTAIMVSSSFGPQANYLAPVVYLGESAPYKNQGLWLRLDMDDLPAIDESLLLSETFVIRKRPGDALVVLPALARFWNKIPEPGRNLSIANMEKIRNNSKRFFDFIDYHSQYKYPYIPDMDYDAALYQDGFFSRDEKKEMQLFHAAAKHEKKRVLESLASPRVKILAERILIRNFEAPCDDMPGHMKDKGPYWDILRSKDQSGNIAGYKNDAKLSCRQALDDLKEIEKEMIDPAPEQKAMLTWLENYINGL